MFLRLLVLPFEWVNSIRFQVQKWDVMLWWHYFDLSCHVYFGFEWILSTGPGLIWDILRNNFNCSMQNGKKVEIHIPVFDLDPLVFEYPFHQSNWPRGHPDTKTRNSEDQNYLLWHKIDLIESLLWHGVPHCLWWWQRNLKQRLFCGIQWTQNV